MVFRTQLNVSLEHSEVFVTGYGCYFHHAQPLLKEPCCCLVPEVMELKVRDAVLRGPEDFDVVEELIGMYRMSVASGSLAIAHNALATLGRLQNLEPARRVEVRNLDAAEMDRQIAHYLDVIGTCQKQKAPGQGAIQ